MNTTSAGEPEVVILPNASALRILSMGHATSLADLYWLKLVQYVGTVEEATRGWPELEVLADLVVQLDPLYGYAYEAPGILLASVHRVEASNDILERGMEQVPDRWQLPFYASFNYWHALGDFRRGGELLIHAATLPGSPRYLADLGARLYSSAGGIDEGLAIMDMTIQNTSDPTAREGLEHRRDQLLAEKALQLLERRIADYREAEGRVPPSLEDLQDPGITAMLTTPVGETIHFDPATGAVRSDLLPRRLIVYRPVKVPESLAAP